MRDVRTAVIIVFGFVPHSELVARLNEVSDYLELGTVGDDDAVLLPLANNLEHVLEVIDGEGWEVYVVDSDRSVRHWLIGGEEAGYVGQLQAHSRGNIVFETGAYRISRV